MNDNALYPKYRYVMAVLINLAAQLTHVVSIMLTPLLKYVAEDFSITEVTAGYVTTVHVLMMGLFMFVGTIMIGWIDNKRTQLIGITIEILGVIMAYFSNSFAMLIVARIFTGMGHGISGACTNSVVAAWFPDKEKPALITADTLGYLAITMLTYTFTIRVFHSFGDSWKLTMLAMGGVLVVVDVLWLIFARDNHALNAYIKERSAQEGKKITAFSGMKEALRRKDVWIYCLSCAMYTIASTGISTYLPQFLQNYRGFGEELSSSIIGIASAVGIGATFLGGIFATWLGKRKHIVLPCIMLCAVCLTAALSLKAVPVIIGAYMLFTASGSFRIPANGTIPTELKNGSPALTSSTAAMSYGLGYMGSFLASPILALSTMAVGSEKAMLVFVPLLVGAFIFAAFMPETGPGRKKASA